MMLPETEAKTKVCPLMSNQHGSVPVDRTCLASGCMKWRWVQGHSPEEAANWDPLQKGVLGYCGA